MKNVATLWPHYLEAGITRAIVTMTLENDQERRDLLAALGGPDATVVRLEASQETRVARIKAREFGELRTLFLEKTEPLQEQMLCLGIGDIVLTNEDDPRLVATRLLEELGWI